MTIARKLMPVVIVSVCITGCSTSSHAQRDSLVGSGVGAAAGAIVGHQSGNAGTGAAIGAISGAIAGGLVGDAKDAREERDAAYAHAHHIEQEQRAAAMAITNADVISMARSRVGDAVIMNAIQSRGGRFDVSPEAIVQMKQNGVSDGVIFFMQQNSSIDNKTHIAVVKPIAVVAPPVYTAPPKPSLGRVFFGRPRGFGFGPRRHHRRWR